MENRLGRMLGEAKEGAPAQEEKALEAAIRALALVARTQAMAPEQAPEQALAKTQEPTLTQYSPTLSTS